MEPSNFILFSDCILVKGHNRSTICDTLNNNYHIIPNGLYEILEEYNGKSIEEIKNIFNHQFDEIIDDYFDFLIDEKLIFFNSNPDLFPKVNVKWSSPSLITNVIIDYNEKIHDFKNLISQFELLKCSNVQLRFFQKVEIEYVYEIITLLKEEKSRIVSIDLIFPFDENINLEELKIFLSENTRVHSIVLFNSPYDKCHDPINKKMGYILQVKKNIINEKNCGLINDDYFNSNIKLFSESQKYNTCLNRKLSIDKDGNIKNCPSMQENFGNINDTTLKEALNKPNFKKYWNINKEQIDVCKDCEFRHICTDCRAYIEDSENIYSKPLKCGYNPYTNEWAEWSLNPLKQKAIKHYEMTDLVKKNA